MADGGIDCEQLLQQIDTNVKQLLQDNADIVEQMIENKKELTTMSEELDKALNKINSLSADTNKVSKAILNYLKKVQNFLKI